MGDEYDHELYGLIVTELIVCIFVYITHMYIIYIYMYLVLYDIDLFDTCTVDYIYIYIKSLIERGKVKSEENLSIYHV